MVIEWLKIRIPQEIQEKYIDKDEKIWTSFLMTCPGFSNKEVWINPENPTEIILVIEWQTREHWKSIPQENLEQIQKNFELEMGDSYEIIESFEYQVCKLAK